MAKMVVMISVFPSLWYLCTLSIVGTDQRLGGRKERGRKERGREGGK